MQPTRTLRRLGALALVCVAPLTPSGTPRLPTPEQRCDRRCLQALVDKYLASLANHDPTDLPLAEHVKFTENGDVLRLGDGLWRTANALGTYRVYALDPDSGAAAVQTVLRDGGSVVQLLVRVKVSAARIAEVETLVAREGDTCCWAPQVLDSLAPIYTSPLPATEHPTRGELVGAADAYFSALHAAGTPDYHRPPIAAGMNRYENGKQTTNVRVNFNRLTRQDAATQLDSAMFGRIAVVHRRYPVVDSHTGVVLGIVVFQYPTSARPSEIISEFFKIQSGQIREIRAVMVKRPSTSWN